MVIRDQSEVAKEKTHIKEALQQCAYCNSKKGSHVYFLLQVFWVILLFDINVVLMLPWRRTVIIVQSDVTIVVPWQLSTGSKHDYLFCYCPHQTMQIRETTQDQYK